MAVVIETTIGDITVDLYLKERPRAALNFLKLCKLKYYNYNLFHTIQHGFIAQTGDPGGSGEGGSSIWGVLEGKHKRYFEGESVPKIRHTEPGLLSMVCAGEGLIGSQFFFTLGPDLASLDGGGHVVIGEVTEGHERLVGGRIAADEDIDDTEGKTKEEIAEMLEEKEAKARATILEIVGDIPDAEIAPPENVLFVCKLNPVTTDDDLQIIFSRFGKIKGCEVIRDKVSGDSLQYAFIEFEDKKSCENAYFKMDNVLIDDRRIHVDFSQSVAKIRWRGKGRGIEYMDGSDKKSFKDIEYKDDRKGRKRAPSRLRKSSSSGSSSKSRSRSRSRSPQRRRSSVRRQVGGGRGGGRRGRSPWRKSGGGGGGGRRRSDDKRVHLSESHSAYHEERNGRDIRVVQGKLDYKNRPYPTSFIKRNRGGGGGGGGGRGGGGRSPIRNRPRRRSRSRDRRRSSRSRSRSRSPSYRRRSASVDRHDRRGDRDRSPAERRSWRSRSPQRRRSPTPERSRNRRDSSPPAAARRNPSPAKAKAAPPIEKHKKDKKKKRHSSESSDSGSPARYSSDERSKKKSKKKSSSSKKKSKKSKKYSSNSDSSGSDSSDDDRKKKKKNKSKKKKK
ncbi:AAEL005541-PA [Aedes aegypti]|uniref:Peptidyl-prolyl cis-trans isomerase n=1 Tax=Aedes aegypti TaxID=7159 RepID=Q179Q7_AEDAE|nr:AAEL005541-PA [Aedes aegypti]